MEKRLNAKIDVWTTEFKGALAGKIQIMDIPDDTKAPLLQFIYDYAHLVVFKSEHVLKIMFPFTKDVAHCVLMANNVLGEKKTVLSFVARI